MDENRNLIGFENGVYDLVKGIFRYKNVEDNISLSTGYNYIEYYNKCEEFKKKVEIIESFLSSIQPDLDERNNLKKFLASMLCGNIKEDKYLTVLSGVGSNGKTTLLKLMEKVLGEYYLKIDSSLIKKSNEIKMSPSLLNTRGRRCLEINNNIEEKKQEKISVRGLYGEEVEFKPQFKLVYECNDYNLKNNNINVFNFPNSFVVNNDIEKKLEECKEVIVWLLINNYYEE